MYHSRIRLRHRPAGHRNLERPDSFLGYEYHGWRLCPLQLGGFDDRFLKTVDGQKGAFEHSQGLHTSRQR